MLDRRKQKNVSKSEWPKTLKSLNQRKKLFDFYDFKAPAWDSYPKSLPLHDKTPNSKVQPVNGLRQSDSRTTFFFFSYYINKQFLP